MTLSDRANRIMRICFRIERPHSENLRDIVACLEEAMRDQRHACAEEIAGLENPFREPMNISTFDSVKQFARQAVMKAEVK